jgi:hypothetical protein
MHPNPIDALAAHVAQRPAPLASIGAHVDVWRSLYRASVLAQSAGDDPIEVEAACEAIADTLARSATRWGLREPTPTLLAAAGRHLLARLTDAPPPPAPTLPPVSPPPSADGGSRIVRPDTAPRPPLPGGGIRIPEPVF